MVPKRFIGTPIQWKEGRDVTVEEQKKRVKAPKVCTSSLCISACEWCVLGAWRGQRRGMNQVPRRHGCGGGGVGEAEGPWGVQDGTGWNREVGSCARVGSAGRRGESTPYLVVCLETQRRPGMHALAGGLLYNDIIILLLLSSFLAFFVTVPVVWHKHVTVCTWQCPAVRPCCRTAARLLPPFSLSSPTLPGALQYRLTCNLFPLRP